MNFASRSCFPSMPDFPALSDPERSTSYILEQIFVSDPCLFDSRLMMKIQCDHVETSFIGVSEIARFVCPMKRRFKAASSDSAQWTERF